MEMNYSHWPQFIPLSSASLLHLFFSVWGKHVVLFPSLSLHPPMLFCTFLLSPLNFPSSSSSFLWRASRCPNRAATTPSPRTISWRWATPGWSSPTLASRWTATPMPRWPTPPTSPSWTPSPRRPWPKRFTPTAGRPPWPPTSTSAPPGPPTPPWAPAPPPILARSQLPRLTAVCAAPRHRERPPGAPRGRIQPRRTEGPRAEKLCRRRNRLRAPDRMRRGVFSFPSSSSYSNDIHNYPALCFPPDNIQTPPKVLHHCIWHNITDTIFMLGSGCQFNLRDK